MENTTRAEAICSLPNIYIIFYYITSPSPSVNVLIWELELFSRRRITLGGFSPMLSLLNDKWLPVFSHWIEGALSISYISEKPFSLFTSFCFSPSPSAKHPLAPLLTPSYIYIYNTHIVTYKFRPSIVFFFSFLFVTFLLRHRY